MWVVLVYVGLFEHFGLGVHETGVHEPFELVVHEIGVHEHFELGVHEIGVHEPFWARGTQKWQNRGT